MPAKPAVPVGLVLVIAATISAGACRQRPVQLFEPADMPAGAPAPDTLVVLRSRAVRIDVAGVAESTAFTLPTFERDTLRVVRDRIAQVASGGIFWYGHVDGVPGSTVTFLIRDSVLVGNIRAGRRAYEIRFLERGIHRLDEVDPARYPDEAEPLSIAVSAAEADACATDPPTEIDVLVVYTDDARTAAGGVAAIEATVWLALEETNQSYINSNVTQRVRLAHMAEVNYAESGASATETSRLQATADGFLDNVHTLRNTHGADVVLLITESLEACGRAAGIMSPVSTGFETSAFGVVKRTCAAGNYSFGHELGHLMGARHDWAVDPTNNSPYAFNHGFTMPAPGDAVVTPWRTVMAYNNACLTAGTSCTRLMYWSNPGVSFPAGGTSPDPMGVSTGAQQSDNHQALENTAGTVANFRCSAPGATNVWMKDTWNDTGLEPDPATAAEPMWQSPYIWVRTAQDAGLTHQHQHQNPELGSANWVYVKLHNAAASAQSGTLELYYADAATSLAWPAAWTLIGSVPVSNLVAHGTRIVEQQWASLPSAGHFCLLARWVSAADPMTTAEGADIGANVRANNNLAWRNVNVVDLSPDAAEEDSMIVRNSDRRRPMSFSLTVGWRGDERRPSFLPVGEVSLRLDPRLSEAWKRGGGRATGLEARGERLLVSADGGTLDSLMLGPGAEGWLYLRMRRLPTTPGRTWWLSVTQSAADSTIGGVTYEIRTDRP